MTPDYFNSLISQEANIKHFKSVLPSHIPVEKFIATAKAYFSEAIAKEKTAKLLNASERSVLLALHKAARDGLLMDGHEACFMTFDTETQYCQMVWGLVKLVMNTGAVSKLAVHRVFSKELFKFKIVNGEEIMEHEPLLNAPEAERGERLGVYATARTKDGTVIMRYLNNEDIAKSRAKSQNQKLWAADQKGMEEKTALRRLTKFLPKTAEIQKIESAIFSDDVDDEPTVANSKTSPEAIKDSVVNQSSQNQEETKINNEPSLLSVAQEIAEKTGLPGLKAWYDGLSQNKKDEATLFLQSIINKIKSVNKPDPIPALSPPPPPPPQKQTSAKLASVVNQSIPGDINNPANWNSQQLEQEDYQMSEGDFF